MKDLVGMPELKDLAFELSEIADAIHAVVGVDVTILDHHLLRIAGTGAFKNSINCIIDDHSVFSQALKDGKMYVIDDPRNHQACAKCLNKKDCLEYAHVCCPISLEKEKIVGVIGLVAFTLEQRKEIIEKEGYLLNFLDKMAKLIATRLNEFKTQQALKQESAALEILINALEHAVISVDNAGLLNRWNNRASQLFGLEHNQSYVFDTLVDKNYFARKKLLPERFECVYKLNGRGVRLFAEAVPVQIGGELDGYVVQFKETQALVESLKHYLREGHDITFDDILCSNAVMHVLKDYAKQVANTRSSVLITGESGTGKELFARAIHHASPRKNHAFVAINCAAIPENLLESELFGYEEGTFTGGKKGGKLGKLELADQGTLFLDEIGDMPLHLQAKLLRFLQDGELGRLGGLKTHKLNVRVISATHRPIEQMVKEGAFREDLYYRLNVVPLHVPPLRERIQDLSVLVPFLVDKHCQRAERPALKVNPDVYEQLSHYPWPGNVRELENAIEFAVNISQSDYLTQMSLPKKIGLHLGEENAEVIGIKAESRVDLESSTEIIPLWKLEEQAIIRALDFYGKQGEGIENAAKALGLGRATLYRRMKVLKISK